MNAAAPGGDPEEHAPCFGDPWIAVELGAAIPAADDGTVAAAGGSAWSGIPGTIRVGLDPDGLLPAVAHGSFDLLLTGAEVAPRPWVGLPREGFAEAVAALHGAVRQRPLAASVLAQLLRIGATLPLEDALVLESFAYSTLLGGAEFRAWRSSRPARASASSDTPRVRCTRDGDRLAIHLAHARRHNAFDARMRDELVEALRAAAADPTLVAVELRSDGPEFSSGGDLDEFGAAQDLALAHAIRTLRSPARELAAQCVPATAWLQGACVGAGIEVPAAAKRVVAAPGSWFWLPEVAMGLIPGAGGTATIARRIGRHRLLYWALAGRRLDTQLALGWGLIDAIGTAA